MWSLRLGCATTEILAQGTKHLLEVVVIADLAIIDFIATFVRTVRHMHTIEARAQLL